MVSKTMTDLRSLTSAITRYAVNIWCLDRPRCCVLVVQIEANGWNMGFIKNNE